MAEGQPNRGRAPGGGKPPDFDLLRHNLGMAAAVEEFLGSTFGPGGRAKLFRTEKGEPRVTTYGVRMLENLKGRHPLLRLLVATAQAQEEEWADGTKLAVLLALRLLRRAGELLEQGLRAPHILEGYRQALGCAQEAAERVAAVVAPTDPDVLLEVAESALATLPDAGGRATMARAVADAVIQVAEPADGGHRCDWRNVHVFPRVGPEFSVELIRGYVLHRTRDHPGMPARVRGARIALLDAAPIRGKAGIHAPRLRWLGESKVLLASPGEIEAYQEWADDYTEALVDGLREAGTNVVLCRLGISDLGHKLLANAGILAIRTLMKTKHMEAVARATGARLVKDFREVRAEDLGRAGLVEERSFGDEKALVITDCANPRTVSLLVRAPGAAIAEEYGDQSRRALGAVAATVEDPRLLTGGAGVEVAAARAVRGEAPGVGGRPQLAALAFATALEDLAALLAGNLGMDPTDAVLAMRQKHTLHPGWGLSAAARAPVHGAEAPRDPLAPRLAAWRRAVETCATILRVDDVHKTPRVTSKKPSSPKTRESLEEDEDRGEP